MSGPRAAVAAPLREYLARLDRAARVLPLTQRQDLRARIWHEVAQAAGPDASDERLTAVLERMGPPEEQVRVTSPGGGALRDPLVVHLLGCSVLTLGVTGVVGLVRVWRSPSWPARDAALATLLVAAGAVLFGLLVPGYPLLGPLFGGLAVGALAAALALGTIMMAQRRALRRLLRSDQQVPADRR